MKSLFARLLERASRLTQSGRLQDATDTIQRALASAGLASPRPPRGPGTGTPAAANDSDILDGLVREVPDVSGERRPAADRPAPGSPQPSAGRSAARTPESAAAAGAADVEVMADTLEPARGEARSDHRTGADTDTDTDAAPLDEAARALREHRFDDGSYTNEAGTRAYKLFVPADVAAAPERPVPLLVMLHGCTQNPDDFAAGTRMNELARQHGFVVLYPAQVPRANSSNCWNWFRPADQQRGRGEPSLIAGMTRHVMRLLPVDPDRVYVAGLSAGGAMASILGHEYADLYAAIGVHSGLPHRAAHDLGSALAAMKQGKPDTPRRAPPTVAPPHETALRAAPAIVFHGDADTTVHPLNGERIVDTLLRPAEAGAADEAGVEVSHASTDLGGGRSYKRTTYRTPDERVRAELWLIHGAGHGWSGGDPSGSYADPSGPDASREMLRFFLENPRRAP